MTAPDPVAAREPAPPRPVAGSLFSGVAGLDIATEWVLGTRPAWFCDNDPAAARVLAHRFPGVPNLGDITTVDWDSVAPVDVLTGGFPCQDLSAAGRQAGLVPGTRSGLWWRMAAAVAALHPRVVVIENVRNLLNAKASHPAHDRAAGDLEPCPWCVGNTDQPAVRALGAVLGDLADLGYDAVWHGLPAAHVGAPHERFRVFILAVHTDHADHGDPVGWLADAAAHATGQRRGEGWSEPAGLGRGPDAALGGSAAVAHADDVGHERDRHARDGWDGPAHGGQSAAHSAGQGRAGQLTGAAVPGHGADPDGAGQAGAGGRGRVAADPDRAGLEGHQPTAGHHMPARRATADTHGGRQRPHQSDLHGRQADPARRYRVDHDAEDIDWGIYTAAVRRWEHLLGRAAPTPRVVGPRSGLKLNPALGEWMQGFAPGWFTAVPGIGVNAALRLAGNSVNPHQAAAALRWCLDVLLRTGAARVPGSDQAVRLT